MKRMDDGSVFIRKSELAEALGAGSVEIGRFGVFVKGGQFDE